MRAPFDVDTQYRHRKVKIQKAKGKIEESLRWGFSLLVAGGSWLGNGHNGRYGRFDFRSPLRVGGKLSITDFGLEKSNLKVEISDLEEIGRVGPFRWIGRKS